MDGNSSLHQLVAEQTKRSVDEVVRCVVEIGLIGSVDNEI